MAHHRSSQRSTNAWPGWVDALSSLIMVVIFLLMVFVISQFYMATALTGRDEQLQRLNSRIAELSDLLNLERESNAELRADAAQLSDELQAAAATREDMNASLTALQDDRDQLARQAAELERTVVADRETIELRLREAASLQNDLKALREARTDLEAEIAALSLLSKTLREKLDTAERDRDRLDRDLTTTREEARAVDEQRQRLLAEAGRQRSRAEDAEAAGARAVATIKLTEAQKKALMDALERESERALAAEAARDVNARALADAQADAQAADRAKAEALARESQRAKAAETERDRLAEGLRLTEEQKKALMAELGALRDRSKELDSALADAREKTVLAQKDIDARDIRIRELLQVLGGTRSALDSEKALSADAAKRIEQLSGEITALRTELQRLNAALDASEKVSAEQKVQIVDLGSRLNQALASKVQELARYRSEFFGRVREALGERSDIRITGDRFVFQSELLFPTGSATLQVEGQTRLAELARSLTEVASRMPGDINWVLRVDGHTDSRPIKTTQFPSNWELSAARAISVARFLMDQGVAPDRLAIAGFGEYQPLDSGTSEEAMARNRRIELKLDQK